MSKTRQAERFRKAVKKALVDRNRSITSLASKLGYARNTVSMAINRYKFPGVIRDVREELGISE